MYTNRRTSGDVRLLVDRCLETGLRNHLNRAVVVAVAIVDMVEMPVDQVVGMIPVRNDFVPAIGSVCVVRAMPFACVALGAVRRVGARYGETMLIDVAIMCVVQVAVMQKIDMPVMLNGCVAAACAVLMIVVFVNFVEICHGFGSFQVGNGGAFRSMGKSIGDQAQHMAVRQGVDHVLAFPCTPYQVVSPQHAQTLRNNRHGLFFDRGQFAHARRPLGQPGQQTEPACVAHGAKDSRTALQVSLTPAEIGFRGPGVIVRGTCGLDVCLLHKIDSTS